MRMLLSWLRDFVEIDEPAAAVAETLTELGLEVEAVVPTRSLFDRIVVGKVLEREPMGSGGRLLRCRVSVGGRTLTSVCGDPNVAVGLFVPVALPGAELDGGEAVRGSDMAGERSEAVLCSLYDLGLRSVQDQVYAFEGEPEPGSPVAPLLGLDDTLFEVELTPNRGDCLSVLGFARELAAARGVRVRDPEIVLKESQPGAGSRARIDIEAEDLCSRYVGRVVEGVRVGPSPLWLARRLKLLGVRPINNVVDIANYVMLERGQPLHTFDHRYLKGGRIVVRRGKPGEAFEALDGTSHTLDPDVLVIADAERVVAVAGIVGGTNSGVVEDTRTILIESAHFDPISVRRSARRMGISTEASMRFERGIDPGGVARAADRVAGLLAELAGGTVRAGRIDAGREAARPDPIRLRTARARAQIGIQIDDPEMAELLRRLEFDVSGGQGVLEVVRPSFRNDVSIEADLIEEVARMYGYSRIPGAERGYGGMPPEISAINRVRDRVREVLCGTGLEEAVTPTLVEGGESVSLGSLREEEIDRLRLRNPLSLDQSVLRPGLIPGLLACVRLNLNRRREDVRLFEIGTAFGPATGSGRPVETLRVAAVLTGRRDPVFWGERAVPVSFYDLKGALEDLFAGLRLPEPALREAEMALFEPGSAVEVVLDSEMIGIGGQLETGRADSIGLKEPAFIFELILDKIVDKALGLQQIKDVPRYPAVARDLAVVVDESVSFAQVTDRIRSGGEPLLAGCGLFDVYRGKQVPEGKKSLAYSLIFRSEERTLRDEEVDGKLARIVEALKRELGASLRSDL